MPTVTNLTVEEARRALETHGSVDAAAKALGRSRNAFRLFCRLNNIGKHIGGVQAVEHDPDPALEQTIRELRRHIRQLEEGQATDERVVRRLEAAIAENRPRFQPVALEPPTGEKGPQEMVLLLSDLHASEIVRSEGTQGINEYNWEIMLERLADIAAGIVSHAEHFRFPISKLHVFMLGDMLSGDIHEELAITNDRPTAEAVVDLAYDLAVWVDQLRQEIGAPIHVSAIPGNHPRRAQKPSAKQYHNNADWLMYKLLKALLPHVGVEAPRAPWALVQIAKRWRALLMHGDGIRTTMPGVPWGGVHRRITTIEAQMTKARTPLDYVFMGHWHSSNSLDGIQAKTITNGSVKGPDEYNLQAFGSGRPAAQTLMTFHERRGLTGTYPLELQGTLPAAEGWS